MTDKVWAALVGAGAALVVVLIRDLLLKKAEEERTRAIGAEDVFRRYADPLTAASASLFWRLDEIFNKDGGGAFLLNSTPNTAFVEYKRLSTLYRIAGLLAWVRAYRRELSFLRTNHKERLRAITDAIALLESSLADGHHIEERRLDGLLLLWSGSFRTEVENRNRLSALLEQSLRNFLHKAGASVADSLAADDQDKLCSELARTLAEELRQSPPPPAVVKETRARAIQCLSLREAWLYRDWQAGIGDFMIRPAPEGSTRLFEALGYKDFEDRFRASDSSSNRWVQRLTAITEGLDVHERAPVDARVGQLKSTLVGVARLLLALAECDTDQHAVHSSSVKRARELLETTQ